MANVVALGWEMIFLPRKSHGERSLGGYRPWGCKETRLSN